MITTKKSHHTKVSLFCDWCGSRSELLAPTAPSQLGGTVPPAYLPSGWRAVSPTLYEPWCACPEHAKAFDALAEEQEVWDQAQRAELERLDRKNRRALKKWRKANPSPSPRLGPNAP